MITCLEVNEILNLKTREFFYNGSVQLQL